jgi:hypothetical protein
MQIYVVVDNGDVYPEAYSTYDLAVAAVQKKYPDEYEESKEGDTAHELYKVKENKSGTTKLYIEKGINIIISKLSVKSAGGRKSRRSRKMFVEYKRNEGKA